MKDQNGDSIWKRLISLMDRDLTRLIERVDIIEEFLKKHGLEVKTEK